MGVYTRLYAPIFNYIHMSQAEKTNTSDTSKKPRLYSRGNDQINLDDYVRNLESGFDAWLNSRKIKDKHKDAVREAYREMVTRLNSGDGSFTSRLGGGFQDSTGKIKNADKGFDAAGVAASYLGHTLRGMDIYKEPESTPDPSKIKYGDGALGTALTRRLLGSTGTIQDFIDRDPYNSDTRTRGNSVRSKDFRELLSAVVADLKAGSGEFSDWTEEQRAKSASDLEGLFTIFDNDGQITDDEYLQLARATGMSDLRKMFSTGEQTAPIVIDSDGTEQRYGRTYADKIKAIYRKWRPYAGQLSSPITIGKTDMSRLGPDAKQKIANALNSASTQDLTGIIQDVLQGKVLNTRFISKIFNNQNPFVGSDEENVRNFLLTNAINLLNQRPADHNGGLHNFGESNLGAYYIAGTQTDRNTGFVYDSNNHTISEMSIHDIPYWQNYINNWWDSSQDFDSENDLDSVLTSISAYKMKNGGSIRKYDVGGDFIGNIGHTTNYNWGKNGFNWLDELLADAKSATNKVDFANLVNTTQANHAKLYNKWDGKRAYRGTNDDVKQYQQGIIDNFGYVNTKGISSIRANNYYIDPVNPNTSDNSANNWTPDNYFAAQTDDRRVLGREGDFGEDLDQIIQKFKEAGYRMYLDDTDKYYKLEVLSDSPDEPTPDALAARRTTIASTQSPNAKTEEQLFGLNASDVDEIDTGEKTSGGNNFLNVATSILPGLIGDATRLGLSLRANKKIEKALQPHIALHEPLNIHKRIFGDFATRQNYHRYGAEALSQANRQADADANRNAARMHEAQRLNIESQIKGDLADNAAIQKDLDEQFNLNKWLLQYNRENAYEPNREKIANYQNTIGQIRASRLGKDWKGIDNFIAGLQGRIDSKREALYNIARDNARMEMKNTIEPYQIEFRSWLSNPKNTDITKHPKYLDYLEAVKNSGNTYTQQVNQAALRYAKQGGKIKPKQQDFIAQIIKLNNERNS